MHGLDPNWVRGSLGYFRAPGDRRVCGKLSGEHQSFYSQDIWYMWKRPKAVTVSTEQRFYIVPVRSEVAYSDVLNCVVHLYKDIQLNLNT